MSRPFRRTVGGATAVGECLYWANMTMHCGRSLEPEGDAQIAASLRHNLTRGARLPRWGRSRPRAVPDTPELFKRLPATFGPENRRRSGPDESFAARLST